MCVFYQDTVVNFFNQTSEDICPMLTKQLKNIIRKQNLQSTFTFSLPAFTNTFLLSDLIKSCCTSNHHIM